MPIQHPSSQVKKILSKYGLRPSKDLGQNFLIDETIPMRIVEESGIDSSCGVIEVGPGIGIMTAPLCRKAKRVVAIELDSHLIPVLQETLGQFDNLTILNQDILKTDLRAILEGDLSGMPVHVCANLPYYITTPIIMNLLEARLPLKRITVMVQKEVAQRLCAPPGSKGCGAISYAVSYYTKPHMLFDVEPDHFMPAPKVCSTVISLDILNHPSVSPKDERQMFRLISAAFSQRRKTLKNALSSAGFDKSMVEEALNLLGLSQNIRGECLTLEDFCSLSSFLTLR